MNKEEILLDVLNEHGDFENVRQQFDENDLACILEAMERYKGQILPIDSVVGRSEQLVCKGKCDHGYNDEFGNELFCSIKEKQAN